MFSATFFFSFVGAIFFGRSDSTLVREWAVSQSSIFYHSNRPGLPGTYIPICPFLDHSQGSCYHWHGGSFKVPYFLNFYFLVLIFTHYRFFTNLRVFHTSVNWWFSSGVWVTASLLKSPGSFLVFGQILIILLFGWSPLSLLFSNRPVPLSILWRLYRAHQLQLVSLSCSTVFSVLEQSLCTCLSFRFLSVLPCGQPKRQSALFGRVFFWGGGVDSHYLFAWSNFCLLHNLQWINQPICEFFTPTLTGLTKVWGRASLLSSPILF